MSKFLSIKKVVKKCLKELHRIRNVEWFDAIAKRSSKECRGILTQFKTIHLFYLYTYFIGDFLPTQNDFHLLNDLLILVFMKSTMEIKHKVFNKR